MKRTGALRWKQILPRDCVSDRRKRDAGKGRLEELMAHEPLLCAIYRWVLHLLSPVLLMKSCEVEQFLHLQMGNQHKKHKRLAQGQTTSKHQHGDFSSGLSESKCDGL